MSGYISAFDDEKDEPIKEESSVILKARNRSYGVKAALSPISGKPMIPATVGGMNDVKIPVYVDIENRICLPRPKR